MQKRCFALLLGALFIFGASVQVRADMHEVMQQFIQDHPQARFYGAQFYEHEGFFDEVGTASMIYGTTLAVGATPIESAWNHVNEIQDLLGDEIGVLVPEVKPDGNVILGAVYDRETETYKFSTFRFNQVFNNVPVFRSGVGFLVRNEQGNPLVMATFDVKELAGLNFNVNGQQVTDAMIAAVGKMMDGQPIQRSVVGPVQRPEIEISDEELVIWAGTNNVVAAPELAMKFVATRGSIQTLPDYQKYLVLASVATGEVLYSETMIHSVDINGNVSGRATDGLNALECDPETAVGLPYAQAEVVGGNTTFADANGDFTIPHAGNTAVTVRSRLRGQWFEVFDESAGGATPLIDQSVTPPGPANFMHNPAPSQQFPNANVNAYYESNVVRDYTLFYAPNFPTIANQTFFNVNTNINSSCNAFYDGSSINFYRNAGGCNNTSFSDVVHHEYGHHLVAVTNNGQGQFGEGAGDCMGVLIQDDPILGQGFQNCNVGIRNANNNIQYPCNGAIHDCGQLISGCVWSLRNELLVTEPANYRDIGGSLFVNMLIVRGQMLPGNGTIDPQITIIYLELDDDDGSIGNGTPHYQEIADAFGDHNMDAPPLELLNFTFPNGRPDSVNPAGGVVEFTFEVTGITGTPEPGTGVLYVDRGNGIEAFALNEESTNVYEVVFPAIDCGSTFTYYVSAETTNNQTAYSPIGAPAVRYSALSASSLTVTFDDDFETNQGWTVSGNATDGQWNRGVPVGGGDRGDPPTDADGSGQCYLTDNVDGNSDVDGGSTILTSPVMDGSVGDGESVITYYRWYSNDFGGDPFNDIFVVEISNNGGSSWVNLETVGPTGPEAAGGWYQKTFRIADFVTPTNNVRIRFNASDLGTGSVVEAGVDGVQILAIGCGGAPPATIPADNITVFRGIQIGGTLADAAESDNSYMLFNPGLTLNTIEAPVWLIFDATLPSDSPDTLDLVVESQAGTPGLTATIEAWNWNANAFDVVDVSDSSFNSDTVVTVELATIADYVQAGTGDVQSRVGWRKTGLTLNFPWEVRLDQLVWNVNQ